MELTLCYPQQAYLVAIYAINIRKKNNIIIYPVYIPSNGAGGIASLIDAIPIDCYILWNNINIISFHISNSIIISYKNKCVQK